MAKEGNIQQIVSYYRAIVSVRETSIFMELMPGENTGFTTWLQFSSHTEHLEVIEG